ncbi:MAG: radical SAM protein [bacterium]
MEPSLQTERDSIKTFIRKDLRWQADFLEKHPSLPRQLAIYIETGCDHNCLFCENKRPDSPEDPLDVLKKCGEVLAMNRELNYTNISIAANEALAFQKIVGLVAMCREYGFSNIEIITSGVRLADASFTRTLADAGASTFSIPLYAPAPELHDEIIRTPGAFRMAVAGIENLLRTPGTKVHIHTLALRHNIGLLDKLSSFTHDNFGISLLVFPVRVKKHLLAAQDDARKIVPSFTQLRENASRSLLMGFPRCVTVGSASARREFASAIPTSMVYYILGQKYVHLDVCRRCSERENCIGVVAGYRTLHGTEGITPFSGS